jgi:hypothetical protein
MQAVDLLPAKIEPKVDPRWSFRLEVQRGGFLQPLYVSWDGADWRTPQDVEKPATPSSRNVRGVVFTGPPNLTDPL